MILLLAALIGATLIVVRSTLFRPIRRIWPALLGCSQCAGAWIGAAAGASGLVSASHPFGGAVAGRVIDAAIVGAAMSFLALLSDAILLHLLGDPASPGPSIESKKPLHEGP